MMFVPHREHKFPLSFTGTALLYLYAWCSYLSGTTSLHCLLQGQLYFAYMYDVRTSLEAQAFTACCRDSFTLLVCMKFVPHRKHKAPLSVTETALLYLQIWCSYLTGSTNIHCLLLGQLYFSYRYDVRTSQEAQDSTVCYGGQLYFTYIMKFVLHRKHKASLSVTGTALLYL
jgi:hypothetical protein